MLLPFGRPYRRRLLEGSLASILVVACRLAFPWPIRGVVELAFHRGNRATFIVGLVPKLGAAVLWLAGAFVVIVMLQAVAEYVQRLAFARYSVGLSRAVRETLIASYASGGAPSHAQEPGDLVSRIVGDTTRLKSGVKGGLIAATRNGLFFAGVVAIIGLIDVRIALVFFAGGTVAMLVSLVGARRSRRLARKSRNKEARLTNTLHQTLAGVLPRTAVLRGRPRTETAESRLTKIEGKTTIAVHAIYAATICGILVLVLDATRTRALSPGGVFIILAYALLMHNRTVRTGRLTVRLGRMQASADRLASTIAAGQAPTRQAPPSKP